MPRAAGLILLALATLAPLGAAAQEPLTLDQAVHAALTQNASLRGARASRDEAAAHIGEARSGFFPRLTFTESWQRGDQPVFVFSSLLSARRFGADNFACGIARKGIRPCASPASESRTESVADAKMIERFLS